MKKGILNGKISLEEILLVKDHQIDIIRFMLAKI